MGGVGGACGPQSGAGIMRLQLGNGLLTPADISTGVVGGAGRHTEKNNYLLLMRLPS